MWGIIVSIWIKIEKIPPFEKLERATYNVFFFFLKLDNWNWSITEERIDCEEEKKKGKEKGRKEDELIPLKICGEMEISVASINGQSDSS